jgi:Flp pilus assembly protein TadD
MTERRLATAAADAIAQGRTEEALANYERLYARNKSDTGIVLNYAQLLRKSGRNEQALKILKPLAANSRGSDFGKTPASLIRNEYAAALISAGQYGEAVTVLDKVLANPKAQDFYPDANHLEGIALDAQGQHKDAEPYFRRALETWHGDASAVMNNLALNLASQGNFDEALTLLRRAQVMDPAKTEIAKNIDIVAGLRAAVVPKPPVSVKKK